MENITSALQLAQATHERINSLLNKFDAESPLTKQLELHQTNLKENQNYLENPKHTIAFIGAVGVGKTTAICHLLGLVNDSGEACLSTSSGRTTLCEVEVRIGEQTRVSIDPVQKEQVQSLLIDFVAMVKLRHKGSASKESESLNLPSEVERCLRNMLGLTVLRKEKERIGKKKVFERTDQALKLYTELNNEDAFLDECLHRLRLEERSTTHFKAPNDKPLAWLKDTFERINHGRHKSAPMPKRIIIEVTASKLNSSELEISVVDTKGLDGNVEREDIDRQLNDPRTLAILCTKFNDAPEEAIRNLLHHMLASGMRTQLGKQTIVLALDRADEACKVMAEDGLVADSEDGRSVREEQIKDIFRTQLHLDERIAPNVEFYNAQEQADDESANELLTYIHALRNDRVQRIEEIRDAVNEIDTQKDQAEARAAFEHVAEAIQVWARNSKRQHAEFHGLYKPLVDEMTTKEIYASSLRASVNRSGVWDNFDFYYKLAMAARKKSVAAFEHDLGQIRHVLDLQQEQASLRGAHAFIRQLLHMVESEMLRLYETATNLGRNAFESRLKGDPSFWAAQKGEWGQGEGYKGRIAQGTEHWFQTHNPAEAESKIQEEIMNRWVRFISKIEGLLMQQVVA